MFFKIKISTANTEEYLQMNSLDIFCPKITSLNDICKNISLLAKTNYFFYKRFILENSKIILENSSVATANTCHGSDKVN